MATFFCYSFPEKGLNPEELISGIIFLNKEKKNKSLGVFVLEKNSREFLKKKKVHRAVFFNFPLSIISIFLKG